MDSRNLGSSKAWRQIIDGIDGFLVPISFGLLSMVVLVQLLSTIPVVRSKLDIMEGRFSAVPTQVVPSSVANEQAQLSLRLSPDQTDPGVEVFKNGQLVGDFANSELTVTVHEGDQLTFRTTQSGTVYVVVDHNDPNLLLPAPGQMVELSPQHPQGSLPAAEFTH